MTAKEFLQMGYFLEKRMQVKRDRIEGLRAIAERSTSNYTETKGVGKYNARESVIASLADEEQAIYKDLAELAKVQTEIDNAIKTVSDPRLQLLLELRYLTHQTWEEIAAIMCYDVRHIHRLHRDALESIIVPEKYKQVKNAS